MNNVDIVKGNYDSTIEGKTQLRGTELTVGGNYTLKTKVLDAEASFNEATSQSNAQGMTGHMGLAGTYGSGVSADYSESESYSKMYNKNFVKVGGTADIAVEEDGSIRGMQVDAKHVVGDIKKLHVETLQDTHRN